MRIDGFFLILLDCVGRLETLPGLLKSLILLSSPDGGELGEGEGMDEVELGG